MAIRRIPRLRNMGIRQQFWESGCPDTLLLYQCIYLKFLNTKNPSHVVLQNRNNKQISIHPGLISILMFCISPQYLCSEPPPGAAYVCDSVANAIKLVSSAELADTIENVWLWGGSGVYKVICYMIKGNESDVADIVF